ncbi:MAG: hypothetical protein IJT92_03530 [Spirochaetia bacterium]|nr:hypothetical protein [Spirochaetia bacterium]MBR0318920.1 hypothetical protein [Spirochaetia bacterium]
MENLTAVEQEAIILTIQGKSDIQAYRLTHPRASKRTAITAACKFFAKARAKLNDQDRLKIYNLGADRLMMELDKRLNAKSPIIYQGRVTGQIDDNFTRQRATELLAKIHGIDKPPEKKPETTDQPDNTIHIIID